MYSYTIYPRSSVTFYEVSYYIKWVTTSRTYNMHNCRPASCFSCSMASRSRTLCIKCVIRTLFGSRPWLFFTYKAPLLPCRIMTVMSLCLNDKLVSYYKNLQNSTWWMTISWTILRFSNLLLSPEFICALFKNSITWNENNLEH